MVSSNCFDGFCFRLFNQNLAIEYLSDEPKKVIGSLLQFKLTFNSGAAFSLATSGTIFLSTFSIIVAAAIFYYGRKVTSTGWAIALGLGASPKRTIQSRKLARHPTIFAPSGRRRWRAR